MSRRRQVSFRNRHGEEVDLESVSATTAKNEFGRVLDAALARGAVAITRHDAPRAVLLDIEEYDALVSAQHAPLERLTARFDAMLDGMQKPSARAGVRAAFGALAKKKRG